jgi:hypothetical protein
VLLLVGVAGLPDGSNPKFGYILEGVCMENVGRFYGQLVYFTYNWVYFIAIWYICLVAIWYIFPILEYRNKKNLATLGCGAITPTVSFDRTSLNNNTADGQCDRGSML